MPRHRHAILKCDAVDGDEGNHVGRSQPRVRALVMRQVDQFGGLADAANRGLLDRLALACERDHASVVIGVHLAVQQIDAGQLHGFDNGIDFGRVAALGKVRYAFNLSVRHAEKDTIRGLIRATAKVRSAWRNKRANSRTGHVRVCAPTRRLCSKTNPSSARSN